VRGLDASGCRCRGGLGLSNGFTAEGEVMLLGAYIGGQFSCIGGTVPQRQRIRDRSGAGSDRRQRFMRPAVLDGYLDLTGATVGAWLDDARTWPQEIRLGGFTYTVIDAHPAISTTGRLRWLRSDPRVPSAALRTTHRRGLNSQA
jgi:hypothetical protein